MRVTEQIDAMEVSAHQPLPFPWFPPHTGDTLMVSLLTIHSVTSSPSSALLAMNIHDTTTISISFVARHEHLEFIDIFPAIVKTFFFGYVIGIIGCYKGYHAKRGTESVGIAPTARWLPLPSPYSSSICSAAQITDLL